MAIFVNGVREGTSDRTGRLTHQTVDAHIGQGEASETEGVLFTGRIDEFSIFDRALFEEEVLGLFSAGTAGKCGA